MSKSKTVKIVPAYDCQDDVQSVWGVQFVKQDDGKHVGEVDADLAAEMIELGRAAEYTPEKKAAAAPAVEVTFADDVANDLNARLVKEKVLTKAEFKKIKGTGAEGAITDNDINDYVAAKTPVTPPAPAAVTN